MIKQKIVFSRTGSLINRYLKIEQRFFFTIFGLVILKNLFIIPVPYFIQILVNDYFNLNISSQILIISVAISSMIFLYYLTDNLISYVAEIFMRNFFLKNFIKSYNIIKSSHDKINVFQLPRFLELYQANKEVIIFFQGFSQIIIVSIFSTIMITTYHPIFFFFSLGLIILTVILSYVFYPKILFFSTIVSDIKFKTNEIIMKAAESENNEEFQVENASRKFLRKRSFVFKILLTKTLIVGTILALAQSVFIYVSGQLIIEGSFSIGQFIAAEIILTYLLGSIYQFIKSIEKFIDIIVSLDKLETVNHRDI